MAQAQKSGKLIALEGGEGVGKSTQIQRLRERLLQLFPKREFVFTREPGGTPFADEVRRLIIGAGQDADGKTIFGLFAAARMDHVRRVIVPAMAAGKVVITDRFVGSSYAYQRVAFENPISDAMFDAHLEDLAAVDAFPDLTIILDAPVEVSLARVKARQSQEVTHFDAREQAFHERLRTGYQGFAERFRAYTATVDATQSIEHIHGEVLACVRATLAISGPRR